MKESTYIYQQFSDMKYANGNGKAHVAEMIALLGPPPRELLERSNIMAQDKWPEIVQNPAGELCRNNMEFFGGPFFDEEGM